MKSVVTHIFFDFWFSVDVVYICNDVRLSNVYVSISLFKSHKFHAKKVTRTFTYFHWKFTQLTFESFTLLTSRWVYLSIGGSKILHTAFLIESRVSFFSYVFILLRWFFYQYNFFLWFLFYLWDLRALIHCSFAWIAITQMRTYITY